MSGASQHRPQLLHGPYHPPKVGEGSRLVCKIRGAVIVAGYSNGPIRWPKAKGKNAPLILCGDLVRAVRCESNQAVGHHWGVGKSTVSQWRRVLGVRRYNEGTHQLRRSIAISRTDDRLERTATNSQKPAAVAKRKGRLHTKEWKQKMSAFWRAKGHPPGRPDLAFWTPAQDALLGKATDRAVAALVGRSSWAVANRRHKLGIPAFD